MKLFDENGKLTKFGWACASCAGLLVLGCVVDHVAENAAKEAVKGSMKAIEETIKHSIRADKFDMTMNSLYSAGVGTVHKFTAADGSELVLKVVGID